MACHGRTRKRRPHLGPARRSNEDFPARCGVTAKETAVAQHVDRWIGRLSQKTFVRLCQYFRRATGFGHKIMLMMLLGGISETPSKQSSLLNNRHTPENDAVGRKHHGKPKLETQASGVAPLVPGSDNSHSSRSYELRRRNVVVPVFNCAPANRRCLPGTDSGGVHERWMRSKTDNSAPGIASRPPSHHTQAHVRRPQNLTWHAAVFVNNNH